jgi:hypothetical protein
MISTDTVLILGAGASTSYGFPGGLQLKAEICQEINNPHGDIYKDLKLFANKDMVFNFYNNLLLSSEMSIDAFLEHNQSFSEIGRRAIANILLRKERHRALFDDWINKWLDPKNKDNHWYQLLFSKLNAPFEEFEKNKLKIVTFNYDRSLEYFLLNAMKAKYSREMSEDVLKKLHSIKILHIYGKLGNLPEYDSDGFYVPYDLFNKQGKDDWWREYIYEASKKIITIHQAKEIGNVILEARRFLLKAERIYFLGFGYDKTNMERLFLEGGANLLKENKIGEKCFGTALDLSPHHRQFLATFGLKNMERDIADSKWDSIHRPLFFPNNTIYDFLYYNRYSELD